MQIFCEFLDFCERYSMQLKEWNANLDPWIWISMSAFAICEYGTASNYGSGPETRSAFCTEPVRVLNFIVLVHKKLQNNRIQVQYSNPDLPGLICVCQDIVCENEWWKRRHELIHVVTTSTVVPLGSPDAQARHKGTRPCMDPKLVAGSATDWIITDRIRNCAHNAKTWSSRLPDKRPPLHKEKIVAETIREKKDR